jgi:tetratricopeptide (TPR) repeat protein
MSSGHHECLPRPAIDDLWDFSDPQASETRFRAAVDDREREGDGQYAAELLTQVARAQGLQRSFEDAHATLNVVEERLDGAPDVVLVRYLLERGRVLNSSRQPDRAGPLFERAWCVASSAGLDGLAVDAAHMLAIVDPEASIEWNQRALELARTSPDATARSWQASLYNNLGWSYHERAEYDAALKCFEQALELRQAAGREGAVRVARWCVARALRSLTRVEEALEEQMALLDGLRAAGEEDGYVCEEIGECLLAMGRAEQARPYFARAATILAEDAWLVDREPERLARLQELAGM